MTPPSALGGLWLTVGLSYLVVGIAMAWWLDRRGLSRATALSALACWPLLAGLLRQPPAPARPGPLGARIVDCAARLRATMADPAADDLVVVEDLDELVADLHRADARLAMVDTLLTDVARHDGARAESGLAALRDARTRAAHEVEAVLDGMVQLRLSIGLRSLAGNTVPVRERLQDLRARLGAVQEIADLELDAMTSP